MMVIHLLFIYSTNIYCCYYVPGAVPGTKKMVPPSPMALYPGRLRETTNTSVNKIRQDLVKSVSGEVAAMQRL